MLLNGRDPFTSRWFKYAEEFNIPYKVIIADGAVYPSAKDILNKKFLNSSVDFDYIKYPADSTLRNFYLKIYDALGKVKTPYVVFASNDDFYFFDAIDQSIQFLNQNSDYVASRGEIWDFSLHINPDSMQGLNISPLYGDLNGLCRLYEHSTVLGNNAQDRVSDFALKSNSTWHDVVVTKVLLNAYDLLLTSDIEDIVFADNLICFYLACQGKIHRGSFLYMLHQCHPDTASAKFLHKSPFDWMKSSGWHQDFFKLVENIGSQIAKLDNISLHKAKHDFMNVYYQKVFLRSIECFVENLQSELNAQIIENKNLTFFSFIKLKIKKSLSLYQFLKKIHLFFISKKKYTINLNIPLEYKLKVSDIQNFLKRHTP